MTQSDRPLLGVRRQRFSAQALHTYLYDVDQSRHFSRMVDRYGPYLKTPQHDVTTVTAQRERSIWRNNVFSPDVVHASFNLRSIGVEATLGDDAAEEVTTTGLSTIPELLPCAACPLVSIPAFSSPIVKGELYLQPRRLQGVSCS